MVKERSIDIGLMLGLEATSCVDAEILILKGVAEESYGYGSKEWPHEEAARKFLGSSVAREFSKRDVLLRALDILLVGP